MLEQKKTSPMLAAVDLVRVSVESMTLEELECHALQILDTIAALNDYINSSTCKSANALRNAVQHARKLAAHMRHVRALIDAQSVQAVKVERPDTDTAIQALLMRRVGP